MTGPGPNSYGSTAGVAALVPLRAGGSGDFTPSTRPTLAQVERFIDNLSAMVNAMLAAAGFTIPVTQEDVVLALGMFVEEEVAAICEGINGSGRFGPTAKSVGARGRYALLLEDVQAFITANRTGFELMGAARPNTLGSGIVFKDTDDSGRTVEPIFNRDSFMGADTFVTSDTSTDATS